MKFRDFIRTHKIQISNSGSMNLLNFFFIEQIKVMVLFARKYYNHVNIILKLKFKFLMYGSKVN